MNKTENLTKVCFIGGTRYHQPLDATSEKKFRYLKELGELFVIAFSDSIKPNYFKEHANFYLLPQFPFSILRYLEVFLIAPIIALWLIFQCQVNILVCQSPYEGLAGSCTKIIASWFGRKIILVIENHGDFAESLFLQRKIIFPSFYTFLMKKISNFSLQNADLLRAVSDSTRKQLSKYNLDIPIFQFIAWTDLEAFEEIGNQRENKFNPILVYAGVLIERKGVIHLLNAFKTVALQFPEVKLWLIGKEEDFKYTQQLKTIIKNEQLENQIKFIGEVTQKQLAQKMGEAGIFVLPSYSEGLPRVVIEAMTIGLPVVATNVSGIPQVVENGVTGFLIEPKNETLLAEKITWLLTNPNEALSMGNKARLFVNSFFSKEIYLKGYEQIFSKASDILNKNK